MTKTKTTAYDVVTSRLVELIEQSGALPWERPWDRTGTDAPVSVRGHEYRGVNRLLLGIAGQVYGYGDHRWITFAQAKERGGHVRKGEQSMPVVLWKPVTKSAGTDPATGEETTESYLVARYYRVFNVEQVDGLDLEPVGPERERHDWRPLDRCERVVADMPARPEIRHAGTRAYYAPGPDVVTMPERHRFAAPEGYYGVLFHELAHATGHSSRLARGLEDPAPFGSADYSREELVAELAAAFVCGAVGIDTPRAERNHAAYLANWLRVLRADARMVVTAAARASKAADRILGDQREGSTS